MQGQGWGVPAALSNRNKFLLGQSQPDHQWGGGNEEKKEKINKNSKVT